MHPTAKKLFAECSRISTAGDGQRYADLVSWLGQCLNVVCWKAVVKRVNDFSRILILMTVALLITLLLQKVVHGQTQASTTTTSFWNSLDTYTKVIAGVVAAITATLGVPVAFLQIRKTIAEIHKTELEAKKLQEQTRQEHPIEYQGHQIYMSHSDGNNIQILVDPRFAAPLLIVLDFVIVYMVLALADYALRLFQIEIFSSIVLPIVGAALLSQYVSSKLPTLVGGFSCYTFLRRV
jgi:hypothetical protein